MNKGIGTRNPADIPYASDTAPIKGGNTAPPATAITRKEAPSLVFFPRDLIDRAKIVGNIIDIKKKTP